MKISCNKSNPPLGGLLAVEFYRSQGKNVEVVWGNEASVTLPNALKSVPYGTSNDLIRILENAFNKSAGPLQKVTMNHWLSFSLILDDEIPKSVEYLDKTLGPLTYLVGESLSVSDLAVFSVLHVSIKFKELSKSNPPNNIIRWMKLIQAQPAVAKALKDIPSDVTENLSKASNRRSPSANPEAATGRQQEGKFVELPHAEMGKVVVRFPPEASGFLHIGHAKAALLNQYYQQAFKGKLIMRFDDTNPAKENADFEKVILEDVEMLEIKPDMFTHTSQYFDLMQQLCVQLIKEEKAFVDDTPAEQMKNERDLKQDSKNRSNSVEKNLQLWEEMKKGSDIGVQCCVRAKIDMQSANGCLRDPTIYRCKPEPHPRTGTQYKVYPTYDFACPIVDSVEGVTHVLRTMEYHDRDPQFYWFIDALRLRKPYIWEYSRLSMTNTVLSKRKLTWFVEQGLVDGWDDPRMPTVRGVLRRGMTVEGLRQFIQAQGSSRSVVFMEWDKIWAINKKVIDPIAPRYTALETNPVPVNLKNTGHSTLDVALHPKNADVGTKTVWVSKRLLVDQVDAKALKEGENATFINYGNVMIDKIHKSSDGTVTSIDATPNLDNKDYKKTLKLTWLADSPQSPTLEVYCVYFDHIISKSLLGKDEDFKQFIGHQTRWEIAMLGEPALANVKKGDIIQLQRRGFFRADVAAAPPSPHSGKPTPLVLFHVPDGHTKEMPGQPKPAPAVAAKQTATAGGDAVKLNDDITKQGELVRSLKAAKADKAKVDEAVKALLDLKAKYKAATGQDWKPGASPAPASTPAPSAGGEAAQLNDDITKQGELVRSLKAAKADKAKVDEAVKALLDLKAKYKAATGQDWKPGASPAPASTPAPSAGGDAAKLNDDITKQGELVRSLKAAKADKAKVDEAVKALLNLKAKYKAATGQDWKPGASPAPASTPAPSAGGDAAKLNDDITKQGELVRSLKSAKTDKAKVDEAVKALLDLKAKYKAATGQDWKPGASPVPASTPAPSAGGDAAKLNDDISKQGDLVRSLKAAKADKAKVNEAVKALLDLKAKYKAATGQEWKPDSAPAQPAASAQASAPDSQVPALLTQIAAQGDKVRKIKSEKADKATVDVEVKNLLNLKAQYKSITGTDWTPNAAPPAAQKTEKQAPAAAMNGSDAGAAIAADVTKQGEVVRDLKAKKADKATIDAEVKKLLELKAKYQEVTGTAYAPPSQPRESKPKEKKEKPKEAKKEKVEQPKPVKEESSTGVKKVTRLGMEVGKDVNLPEWYSQVITKSEMIEYYDISGCYILRPWSYSIWERVRAFLTPEFRKLGARDGYFPIFVSKAALEREKSHIADFSPEVAWVTHSGSSELAEHIAIRPTSETAMYPTFAKWIQSHRDLPYKLNQWNNVVRWEFKQPQPFLRTREFLWQEGHTCFRTAEEAGVEVLQVLDLYARVYEELLAIPVIKGRKTEKEKFAGSAYTVTVEAYVPASGRAIQGATSHHLGQNFSKMFEVVYDDPDTHEKAYVYQNSWGITTRTIGVMVLVHGDDQGLVLPPRIADVQTIVVPCGITASSTPEERRKLIDSCKELVEELTAGGLRAEGDYRDNYSPGWKFNHWELKGVPIRIELGPKDMAKGQIVAVRRLNGQKLTLPRAGVASTLADMLETIHQEMFQRATKERDSRLSTVHSWDEFQKAVDRKHIMLVPFCGRPDCEDLIKKDSARNDDDLSTEVKGQTSGAKSLCIPMEQPRAITDSDRCIHPACTEKPVKFTLFGRSY